MKTSYLFPHRFKMLSSILFTISFIAILVFLAIDDPGSGRFMLPVFAVIGNDGFLGDVVFFEIIENEVLDEFLMTLLIISGILFAFSKEKHEDEMVAAIRLHSLAWATIANYAILLFCYIFIYGLPFLNILMGAMFSQLVIFILLFRFKMYRLNNPVQDEE